MRICRKDLSSYQRRSLRTIEIMMGICIGLNILLQAIVERHSLSTTAHLGIAALSITPILGTTIRIAGYLRGEQDEYLRNLVVQSLLWGLSMVMVADTFLGFVLTHQSTSAYFGDLSLDIFVVTSSIALEIKVWRNR